jgi:hypothetical protein
MPRTSRHRNEERRAYLTALHAASSGPENARAVLTRARQQIEGTHRRREE